ncbi:MAG: hypothetical protein Q8K99_04935 [Actinomycetota bacterium]|nr:hypothetical protein [Actinomycetota bacterium]
MYSWVAGTMLASGVLGGLVNYYLLEQTQDDNMPWWQCMAVGIAAAFIVPLFLNMISSGLISDVLGSSSEPGDPSKLFVLAGFCLVAAISSRQFINTVSQRVLEAAREAKEDAAEARATLEQVIEPEDVDDRSGTAGFAATAEFAVTGVAQQGPPLSEDEIKVMQVMANSSFALRSLSGLAKQAEIDPNRTRIALVSLVEKGFVGEGATQSGYPRWFLTTKGRIGVARI